MLQLQPQHLALESFDINVLLALAPFCIKKALALPSAVGGFDGPHNHAQARFALLHARGLNLAGIEFGFGERCPHPSPELRIRIFGKFGAIELFFHPLR